MSRFGAPFQNTGNLDLIAGGTLYVETTGNDDTGDGSQAKPFATPQRACDEVPDGLTGALGIKVGAGSFEAPQLRRILHGGTVVISGSLGSEYVDTSALGSGDFSLVAGTVATAEATTPAHAGLDPTQHFLAQDFGAYVFAETLLTSPANTIRMHDSYTGITGKKVYTFETTFTYTGFGAIGGEYTEHLGSLFFMGISFPNLSTKKVLNCQFGGCSVLTPTASLYAYGVSFQSKVGDVIFYPHTGSQDSSVVAGECGDISARGCRVVVEAIIQGTVSAEGNNYPSNLGVGLCDLQAGAGFSLDQGATMWIVYNMACPAANTSIITATRGARIHAAATGTFITVALAGTAVTLSEGAQATGLGAYFANVTNSVTPGDEIQVGDGAPANKFSDLPITDATTLCRAT